MGQTYCQIRETDPEQEQCMVLKNSSLASKLSASNAGAVRRYDGSGSHIACQNERASVDQADSRNFEMINPGLGSISIETMIYRQSETPRRPLVIANSIEYPMPPSVAFCELMWAHGLQVVFIRRMGYGRTPNLPRVLLTDANIRNGAATVTEASILARLLTELQLKSVVLLGIGSGNPTCYRLCKLYPDISVSIFSNPVFNQDSWIGYKPAWFRRMLRQTVSTKNGIRIAAKGLRFHIKRNPEAFFRQMLQKSSGDRSYTRDNKRDVLAAAELMQNLGNKTMYYDLAMSLRPDPALVDGYFAGSTAVALSGRETTEEWLSETRKETTRLSLPMIQVPNGGMFVAYASPTAILEIVDRYSTKSATK